MIDVLVQIGVTKLGISIALAAVALGTQTWLKRPIISHSLWVMVLAALLLPAVVTVPFPGLIVPGSVRTEMLASGAAPDGGVALFTLASAWGGLVKTTLVCVWLLGTGSVLAWSVARTVQARRLLASTSEPASPNLMRMAVTVAGKVGLVQMPTIHTTLAHVAPMVWWLGRRVHLVIPAGLLHVMPDRQLELVLAHELAHVRRRDYMMRWLEWLACAAFWWNPVAWLARRELRAAEEFCCDATVLATLRTDPRAYGTSLLTVIHYLSLSETIRPRAFASSVDSGGRASLVERRLTMIKQNPSVMRARSVRVMIAACGVFLLPIGLINCGPSRDATAPNDARTEREVNGLQFPVADAPAQHVTSAELDVLIRRVGEALAFAANASEKDRRARYGAIARQIRDATEAGTVNPEQGRSMLGELQAGMFPDRRAPRDPHQSNPTIPSHMLTAGDQRGYDAATAAIAERLTEYRAVQAEVRAAIRAGKISGDEAGRRLLEARRRIGGG